MYSIIVFFLDVFFLKEKKHFSKNIFSKASKISHSSTVCPLYRFSIVMEHSPNKSSDVFPSYSGVSFFVARARSLLYAFAIACSALIQIVEEFFKCVEYFLRAAVVPSRYLFVFETVALGAQCFKVILVKQQRPVHIVACERRPFVVYMLRGFDFAF